ncbi:hypothetical protein GSY69_06285 [Brevibacterium sp. 5221]|uniref:Uncharacterized protein n=1 Tax=Brevibacterium rongguiense TaxID=2695267 RepID=A0A6N9H6B1_9MICO|nr:hypothetical protein [Brevibacterium rongguiense]MYM19588.1 hypothetical protein [Brevibacterium rongguiense]
MSIALPSAAALADWQTLVERARRADPEAAIRLSAAGSTLVLTCAPLYPASLGDGMPLVLGMRMIRLADSSADGLDAVVPAAALLDRFARANSRGSLHIGVPPQEVHAAWAGIAPPRGGWSAAGSVPAAVLHAIARAGIAEIARGTPEGSGAHAVAALRRRVWGRSLVEAGGAAERLGAPDSTEGAGAADTTEGMGAGDSAQGVGAADTAEGMGAAGTAQAAGTTGADNASARARPAEPAGGASPVLGLLPAGAAFGMDALGFLAAGSEPATVFASGPWLRLSTRGGHILTRASG